MYTFHRNQIPTIVAFVLQDLLQPVSLDQLQKKLKLKYQVVAFWNNAPVIVGGDESKSLCNEEGDLSLRYNTTWT